MDFRTHLTRRFARARVHWRRFAETPRGRFVLKALRYAVTAGVAGLLLYQLTRIGWGDVWEALPRTPWFYLIFLGMYFTLPVTQALIFRLLWKTRAAPMLAATLKKRAYDKDVLSYSGDVFLYFWGRRHTGLPARTLAHHIKDNAIVSSIVSTLVAVGLLAAMLLTGVLPLPDLLAGQQPFYVAVAVGAGAVLLGLGMHFWQSVFLLGGRLLAVLAGLHLVRLLVVQGLQITQWAVVLPSVPLQTWFTYLAIQIILSRLPFLPSRDLIFMSVGIGLAGATGVPEAALAGVLGAHSVLDKSLNALLFVAVSYTDRAVGSDAGDGTDGDAAEGLPALDGSPLEEEEAAPQEALAVPAEERA